MAIKFGRKQLRNPTPSRIAMGLDIFSGFASAVLAWIGTASFISAVTSTILQSILGLLVTLAQISKPFFGVKTRLRTVDIEDVTAMEEPEKIDTSNFPDTSKVPKPKDK